MKLAKFWPYTLLVVLTTGLCGSINAAENGISIPRINGVPILADFEGMQPNTPLGRSMSQVEGFVQREPFPGQASAQLTEV